MNDSHNVSLFEQVVACTPLAGFHIEAGLVGLVGVSTPLAGFHIEGGLVGRSWVAVNRHLVEFGAGTWLVSVENTLAAEDTFAVEDTLVVHMVAVAYYLATKGVE